MSVRIRANKDKIEATTLDGDVITALYRENGLIVVIKDIMRSAKDIEDLKCAVSVVWAVKSHLRLPGEKYADSLIKVGYKDTSTKDVYMDLMSSESISFLILRSSTLTVERRMGFPCEINGFSYEDGRLLIEYNVLQW